MDLLDRLLGHDRFTTRRFLEIARALGDSQLDQEFDIGHHTVRRTLEHVIWNIECWTDLMRGVDVRNRPVSKESIADLTERHANVSSQFLQTARELASNDRLNERFLDTLDDPPTTRSFGGAIVHLATHGMHHRAQLLMMFRRLGVTDLPEGDALSWERQSHLDVASPPIHVTNAIDSSPSEAEVAFVDEQLGRFNAQQTGRDDFKPLNLVIRDDDGAVVAGLKAATGWDWLYIQILWVDQRLRRSGLGASLLSQAEDQARQRGCIGSCLSSYDFQAPEFYRRFGYSDFGQIDDYPAGNTMFFLSKRL